MLLARRAFLLAAASVPSAFGDSPLEVAYAGSMSSVMEGPVKQAASRDLHIELRTRAQGSNGLAQLIASGSILPDLFIPITPGPIETVIRAGKAARSVPLARTEMAIAYSPQSPFAAKFRQEPWWKVLQDPKLRFGRTDPVTDPQGRNIIFALQLAEKFYGQPGLAGRVLGPAVNPRQIFSEPTLQARLQSGELDAASAYRIQPVAFGLPFVVLPPEVNLGAKRDYSAERLELNGKTWQPEPLVYFAARLTDAPHPADAQRFLGWLTSDAGQAILRKAGYAAA